MNQTLLSTAYTLIRFAFGSGFFDRTANLVRNLITADMPGAEKKARVKSFWLSEGKAFSGIALDLVIAIVRARFEKG